MSQSTRTKPRRVLGSILLTIVAVTACDAATTAPQAKPIQRLFSIEGDTLECRFGWIVMDNKYVCNEQ